MKFPRTGGWVDKVGLEVKSIKIFDKQTHKKKIIIALRRKSFSLSRVVDIFHEQDWLSLRFPSLLGFPDTERQQTRGVLAWPAD